MKSTIIFLVSLCLFVVFLLLHMLFTFSALVSNIYWCGIVSHQQILMVRHVAPAEIIGVANAAPVSTPVISTFSVSPRPFKHGAAPCPFLGAPCPFPVRHAFFLYKNSPFSWCESPFSFK